MNIPSRPNPCTVTTTCDVVEERLQRRRVRRGCTVGRREVRRVGLGMGDDVQRGAGGVGGGAGDAVGLALERAAVERHEPEPAAQLEPLDDARLGQRPPEPA